MVKMTGRGPAAGSRQTGQCGHWAETWSGVTPSQVITISIQQSQRNKGEQLVFSCLLPQNQNSTSFQSASKKSPNTKTLRACSERFFASTISFLHVVKNI